MITRVIDGETYNTETATLLAETIRTGEYGEVFDELYQTTSGKYFRVYGDQGFSTAEGPRVNLQPLTRADARVWMQKHARPTLLNKHFGTEA